MHQELAELRSAIAHAQSLADALAQRLEQMETPRFADAMSDNLPVGYDTILGYLAKHHPDIMGVLDYENPVATARDGWKLSHLDRVSGHEPVYADAPACLRSAGIHRVRAYPLSLLQRRWG